MFRLSYSPSDPCLNYGLSRWFVTRCFSRVRVARSLVFCAIFCTALLVHLSFPLTIILSVLLRFTFLISPLVTVGTVNLSLTASCFRKFCPRYCHCSSFFACSVLYNYIFFFQSLNFARRLNRQETL